MVKGWEETGSPREVPVWGELSVRSQECQGVTMAHPEVARSYQKDRVGSVKYL